MFKDAPKLSGHQPKLRFGLRDKELRDTGAANIATGERRTIVTIRPATSTFPAGDRVRVSSHGTSEPFRSWAKRPFIEFEHTNHFVYRRLDMRRR